MIKSFVFVLSMISVTIETKKAVRLKFTYPYQNCPIHDLPVAGRWTEEPLDLA